MVIIAILLDGSQENVFHAGQEVRGNIRVETKNGIKMRGIRFEVHGDARVAWSVEDSQKNRRYYTGNENFIELITYVTGSNAKNSEMYLQPGVHTFPLSFVLPNTVPSSFEGLHGSIRYKMKAVVDRPWKIDDSAEILITVIRLIDLNCEPPELREPVVTREEKPTVGCCCHYICCYHCCCIKGLPVIELRINRGCFVPGETITVNGQLVNNSNTNISKTTINFMQDIEFCATTRGDRIYTRNNQYKILESKQRPNVESGHTDTWSEVTFTVPSTAEVSRLDGCNIINITYYILVNADFPGGCAYCSVRQNVIIGHIPLQGDSQFGGPITTQPTVFTSPPPFQQETQLFSEQSSYSGVHGPGWNQGYSNASMDHS